MRSRLNKIAICLAIFGLSFLFFGILPISAQNSANRYALVIGNANYSKLPKLRNSVNDASDMADLLKELDWNVTVLLDADLPKMERLYFAWVIMYPLLQALLAYFITLVMEFRQTE